MQVGGDGLFQEVLNGLLSVRGAGGAAGELAAHLRLGHIPAGSTDAVAFSLNGTRSQATAALHIALGDRHVPPAFTAVLWPSALHYLAIVQHCERVFQKSSSWLGFFCIAGL